MKSNGLEGIPHCPYCDVDAQYKGFTRMKASSLTVGEPPIKIEETLFMDIFICPKCKITRMYESGEMCI